MTDRDCSGAQLAAKALWEAHGGQQNPLNSWGAAEAVATMAITAYLASSCDCMVCRNRRHREAVRARHNAGQDYPGIRARIMERVSEGVDPNWKHPK